MANDRPTRTAIAGMLLALVGAAAVAIWRAPLANWDVGLLAVLLAFSIFSDLTALCVEF